VAHRLLVALIAKGSINNLHRPAVVEEFRTRGIEVQFLLREQYADLVPPLPGAGYVRCRFPAEVGPVRFRRDVFRYLRSLYPDEGLGLLGATPPRGPLRRLARAAARLAARRRRLMALLLRAEARLYRDLAVDGLDPDAFDQLLLQGIGTHGAEHEAILTWWARQHGRPVVHMIGNYDHLASKGFRGVPVDRLLVWGPVMRDDAARLHAVPPERIEMIGPVRYDAVVAEGAADRATFLAGLGLDPARRTILFAGSLAEHHYFEMLQAFDELRAADPAFQLILRIYPDKTLMASAYAAPLIHYARSRPGVYVSLGDPHPRLPGQAEELPQIEQAELWGALRHADVVVNLYSTIALEACLFDTPAVYMAYQRTPSHGWHRPPVYVDYGRLLHNRRLIAYGATPQARSRAELLRLIREAVANRRRHHEARRRVIAAELGPVDGRAGARLAAACQAAFAPAARPSLPAGAPGAGVAAPRRG
jgi:hypothetical protein